MVSLKMEQRREREIIPDTCVFKKNNKFAFIRNNGLGMPIIEESSMAH